MVVSTRELLLWTRNGIRGTSPEVATATWPIAPMWTPSLEQVSVGSALVCMAITIVRYHRKSQRVRLEDLLGKLLAGSAIPTSLFLLACAFNRTLIPKLTDLGIY